MKRKRKNVILSLVLSFCLCFSVAVSFPQAKTAKALDSSTYSIYDYEWANYFDFSKVSLSVPTDSGMYTGYNLSISSNGIVVTITDLADWSGSPEFNIDIYYRDSTAKPEPGDGSNVISYCKEDSIYSFSCALSSSVSEAVFSDVNFGVGYILTPSNVFSPLCFDCPLNSSDTLNYDSISIRDLYYRLSFSVSYPLDYAVGDSFTLSNIAIFAGSSIYEYTDYFYSLSSIPDPAPGIVGDDNDDSGSGNDSSSSSDSSSSDSSGSGDEEIPSGDYEQGYLDGLEQAQYGFFAESNILVSLAAQTTDGELNLRLDSYFNRIYGGYDFTPAYTYLKSLYSGYSVWNVYLTITFKNPVPASQFLLRATGLDSAFTQSANDSVVTPSVWSAYGTNGYVQDLTFVNLNVFGTPVYESAISFTALPSPFSIQSFVSSPTSSNSFAFLEGLQLYVADNTYQQGYDHGYSDGLNDDGAYNRGYDEGKEVGLVIGEDTGFKKGLMQAESDDPYGVVDFAFALLDMPGRIIYNWLNFDFLGINLAGLVATIITLVVVAFVFKLKVL